MSRKRKKFRQSIGDCIPQPWGNLSFCLMEQQRYDEAEAAWKRALAIDWRYSLARMNLKGLKDVRRGKQVAKAVLVESYEGGKVKKKFVLNEEKPEL